MNLTQTATRTHPRRGFTLIELLVVVGIIALLVSIVVIVGSRAFRAADATRLTAQLQTIEKALDAYKTDFGSFPVTSTAPNINANAIGHRGARLLCKALVAPGPQGTVQSNESRFDFTQVNQDGNDGPGFRVPPRSGVFKVNSTDPTKLEGKVYGPYLSGSAIGYGSFAPLSDEPMRVDTKSSTYNDDTVLADANGNVILYYPVINSAPPLSVANADTTVYLGDGSGTTAPMYRYSDNNAYYTDAKKNDLLALLVKAGKPKNKYLLITAGRDGIFGPNQSDKNKTNDDVTNFAN